MSLAKTLFDSQFASLHGRNRLAALLKNFGISSDGTDEPFTRHFISPGVHYLLFPCLGIGIRSGWGTERTECKLLLKRWIRASLLTLLFANRRTVFTKSWLTSEPVHYQIIAQNPSHRIQVEVNDWRLRINRSLFMGSNTDLGSFAVVVFLRPSSFRISTDPATRMGSAAPVLVSLNSG
ncbi:MAG TPA: hypothetical protein DDW52_21940 [Planctomycetaceae bacterium]|nr:hypothetical protein [Planctomycetaceae bacterium]